MFSVLLWLQHDKIKYKACSLFLHFYQQFFKSRCCPLDGVWWFVPCVYLFTSLLCLSACTCTLEFWVSDSCSQTDSWKENERRNLKPKQQKVSGDVLIKTMEQRERRGGTATNKDENEREKQFEPFKMANSLRAVRARMCVFVICYRTKQIASVSCSPL